MGLMEIGIGNFSIIQRNLMFDAIFHQFYSTGRP